MTWSSGRVSSTVRDVHGEDITVTQDERDLIVGVFPNDPVSQFFPHTFGCETYQSTGLSVHLRYIWFRSAQGLDRLVGTSLHSETVREYALGRIK